MDEEYRYRHAVDEQPWLDSVERMDRSERRWLAVSLLLAFVGAAVLLWAGLSDAKAQALCGTYAEMRDALSEHNESVVAVGLTPDGSGMFQVFATAEGDTFSIILVGTNGVACLIAVGHDWQMEGVARGRES